jgi:GNAT superfamily N-acetyltransferase
VTVSVRDAVADDVRALISFDPLADAGDGGRATWIRDHVAAQAVRVAELDDRVVGYCAVETSFFGQDFVELLVVAEHARREGVGTLLMRDAERRCRTRKLFTSTNLSNHPMQSLLLKLGWQSAGIVYGLDEGDPELIFVANRPRYGRVLSSGVRRFTVSPLTVSRL